MRRRRKGQSIVEMAMVLPIIFLFVFGIVDFSWFIFGYITLYQSARDGAHAASKAPPFPSRVLPAASAVDWTDPCNNNVLVQMRDSATLFGDVSDASKNFVKVVYPEVPAGTDPNAANGYRRLGGVVEVQVRYQLQPLSPLLRLIRGNNPTLNINVDARRTIQDFGVNPDGTQSCRP